MCYNQTGDISTLDGTSLKLVDKFTYLGSSISSTEKDIDTRLTKAWTAIDRLSIIWKSDLTDKMKRNFFQAAVVSILLYGCTTWTLTKRLAKKLDGNYTRMLRAILNKSWRQHPTRHQLYGHLPPIMKTIQVRRTRHAEHCWRSRDELISDVLLWTPTKMGQGKIPWYTHRLMHRKRVTCELHDSYFRLMTIKHAIPKIEWAIELLYNPVSWKSDELETRCGREIHHPAEGALGIPSEFGDPLVTRCGRETSTQQKAEPPGLRLSSTGEQERHNADGHKSGGQYIAVLFGLQLPLTHKPFK